MPLNIDFVQILLHMFNFLLLFGGLTLLLFKPVNKFLEDRKRTIEESLRDIQQKTAENEARKARYENRLAVAEEQIAQKKAAAEKEIAETSNTYLTRAKEQATAIVLAAEKEAEERKEHILDAAQSEIGELVIYATEKLLSESVTPEHDRALYDEFIRRADETIAAKRAKK